MKLKDQDNRLKQILHRLPIEACKYICRLIYSDPLKNLYWLLLIIYLIILMGFLLWPFDFYVYVKNDAHWIEGSKGIEFLETGQAVSNSSTQKFFDLMTKGSGLTLELWIEAQDLKQSGPARILSYSINPYLRNFTIAQSFGQLIVRLRTTETSRNGTKPHLIVEDIFNYRNLQHVVVTYDFIDQIVYINGEQRTRSDVLKGNFSNWDPSCSLAIGNEITGNRPWKGKIYYAAVYKRPLSGQEIHRNYLTGLRPEINKERVKKNGVRAEEPVARYLFEEGKGNVIQDIGSNPSPVNLSMPNYIQRGKNTFLDFSRDYLKSRSWFSDVVINIMIFIPLGVLMHGMLRARGVITLKISLKALLAGALITFSVESIQFFSLTRDSSLIDVVMNIGGTALGIAIDRVYNLFLNHRSERLQKLLYEAAE